MILQGVKLTIQPLGVGYANRPKKAKMGGYVAFSPYIRLPGFDLTSLFPIFQIIGLQVQDELQRTLPSRPAREEMVVDAVALSQGI